MNKKGSFAMEFLLTYSWALLVVIGLLSLMAYFGLFNYSVVTPHYCVFDSHLSCDDYSINEEMISLFVTNMAGQPVRITKLTVGSCYSSFNAYMEPGDSKVFEFSCNLGKSKDMIKTKVRADYVSLAGLDRRVSGEISTQIN